MFSSLWGEDTICANSQNYSEDRLWKSFAKCGAIEAASQLGLLSASLSNVSIKDYVYIGMSEKIPS